MLERLETEGFVIQRERKTFIGSSGPATKKVKIAKGPAPSLADSLLYLRRKQMKILHERRIGGPLGYILLN
jgi:hypothetical protein